jgi:hypothetical protein
MPDRLPDWETRFVAWLAEIAERPHVYGEHDCMVGLVAGASVALTGIDPGAAHRGKYHSRAGARAYIHSLGYRGNASLLDGEFTRKPMLKAMRGDVVLDHKGIPAIVIGGEAVQIGDHGLVRIPRAEWGHKRAWSL